MINSSGSTRRDYYEMREASNQESDLETTAEDTSSDKMEGPVKATASESAPRRGSWNIMSIFRTSKK